jgi:hypothetical protein
MIQVVDHRIDVGGNRRTRLPGLSRIDAAVEPRAIGHTNGSAVLTDHHLRFRRDRRGQARYGGQTDSTIRADEK